MGDQYLTLVRHAKSSWQNPGASDHERPLNARGNSDAALVANHLAQTDCVPELLLVSSATRAQQTAAYLVGSLSIEVNHAVVVPDLYLSTPESILAIVCDLASSAKHVMVVAHNPGLEELSASLAHRLVVPMPTMAVHHFVCSSLDELSASDDTHPQGETISDTHTTSRQGNCRLLFDIIPSRLR